jgi:hypothetical protein
VPSAFLIQYTDEPKKQLCKRFSLFFFPHVIRSQRKILSPPPSCNSLNVRGKDSHWENSRETNIVCAVAVPARLRASCGFSLLRSTTAHHRGACVRVFLYYAVRAYSACIIRYNTCELVWRYSPDVRRFVGITFDWYFFCVAKTFEKHCREERPRKENNKIITKTYELIALVPNVHVAIMTFTWATEFNSKVRCFFSAFN